MKNRWRASVWIPVALLGTLVVLALSADWVTPYEASYENREKTYHPPSTIHLFSEDGQFIGPFVYETRAHYDEFYRRTYTEIKDSRHRIHFGHGRLIRVDEPGSLYLLGADSRGRDILSRLIYGTRISLSVGLIGVAASAALGLLIGGAAGYFGGRTDQVLMRLAELFIMIPSFYLLLALRSALPATLGSREIYMLIVLTMGLIGWGGMARVIRGMVLSIRESEFVLAARVLGRPDTDILARHVLPHTFSYMAVVVSISIPSFILAESVLSVLGLGIQEPEVSWGLMLAESLSIAHLQLHPWVLAPGILLMLTALCFNLLGDSLRERGSRS